MTRKELFQQIENYIKQIASMKKTDKNKVAQLILDSVKEYQKIDATSFESKELIKIFESMRPDISAQLLSDAEGLLNNSKPYLNNDGFINVQLSLKGIQAQLRVTLNES